MLRSATKRSNAVRSGKDAKSWHIQPRSEEQMPRHTAATPGFAFAWSRAVAPARLGMQWVTRCRARAAQRRALVQLDDRLLRDVGLNRTDVAAECGKWFWLP